MNNHINFWQILNLYGNLSSGESSGLQHMPHSVGAENPIYAQPALGQMSPLDDDLLIRSPIQMILWEVVPVFWLASSVLKSIRPMASIIDGF
ncbi:hypothetical protein MRB53_019635 [Persea americana]|uniref:Uncharacterized protein n=1 Tax=Persea americana TaxID=3435 RepID=A0ACC2KYX4_PERAE|nr:hypothetical protein MRB53_019635 [Persea americana]